MCCPSEQTMIEGKLAKMSGIQMLEFNMMNRTMAVWHELPDTLGIEAAVLSLGMHAEPLTANGNSTSADTPVVPPQPELHKSTWWPLALSGVAAVGAEVLHFTNSAPEWVVAVIALFAIALCGPTTYKKGLISIKHLNLNINALMSIAVTGAVLIGQWPEAAMVMFLFTVAEMVEAKSLDRARNAIKGLMDLTPERATVRQSDGSWLEVDVKTVQIGDLVRVRPGERIGLDGNLFSGSSTVNQAPITGESLPIDKDIDDPVYAGSINESGSFEYRVTAEANNTTLARIIHAVEEAQSSRAPTQRFVDKFAKIYTPGVFFFAVAIAVFPPLFMGGLWTDWIYRALVLLVVACPCALVISTPVSIVSGLAAAARKGILVKGGVYLEIGARLSFVALDKTGTITHGKPVQTDYIPVAEDSEVHPQIVAASLGARSDHPVSQAIAKYEGSDASTFLQVESFEALPGRGVKGMIEGQLFYLGNHRLIQELGLGTSQLDDALTSLERQGKTVVALTSVSQVFALFAVADTVKDSSQTAIKELHSLGIKTMMLTGDNSHTAHAIAKRVGIDEARGNLLPADKLSAIGELQDRKHVVGMVGDGINDAPALAKSQIGFAMAAAGTGTAIETADVALMDDDLRKIPAFVRLSRQTAAILKQNILFSLGIKTIFIVFSLMGLATMWMAVFADVGVSLLVVLNGLRLLKK
ncbi:heavy metal translocating P-type ATPase [Pseudomonas psychrophila]|nr:heavy metal translocating P-type ATPase [Pseudomonas psychrophila]KAB0486079.1 heavy metal translocating P-type ATPase [Pseudomonas psychrophila]KMN02496.1 4-deoxy-4-formamido-L-arabinose-phospho-UDP deformylase [Pseudomonas psychrophila]QIE35228.1 heavy metal translocating P-type ATPase [Pseudomonas psychrophila]WVJ00111.1 heavy metal translocating P-type ATPase [Pseudomonas psychrophila]